MLHSRVTPRKRLLWIGLRENWWVLFCIRTWIDRKEQWINYKPICKKSQERADGILPLWMCPKSEEIMFSTQEPEKVNRAQRRKKNSMRSHFLKHSVCNIAPIKTIRCLMQSITNLHHDSSISLLDTKPSEDPLCLETNFLLLINQIFLRSEEKWRKNSELILLSGHY